MELPQETLDYIRESIDHTVGLPVSTNTLINKLRALEAVNLDLRNQNMSLQSKIKERDASVERSKAEASMSAVALKKFVEENQKLAFECSNLLTQSNEWERECTLYERDRDTLMDFANEADQRAKESELRADELEEDKKKLMEEIHSYKNQLDAQLVDVSADELNNEQTLLDSLLTTMFGNDEIKSNAQAFLEAYNEVDDCQKMLKMWNSLRPVTRKVISLAAKIKNLEKDKDHLTLNLQRAEGEVNALFDDNKLLEKENKRLMKQCYKEKHNSDGFNTGSASGKGKRKCSPMPSSSPMEKKLDFSDAQRQPLSPLQQNSPECGISN